MARKNNRKSDFELFLNADQIIERAEKLARQGNLKAQSMLHLYDLKRAGHKPVNYDIPSDNVQFISKPIEIRQEGWF